MLDEIDERHGRVETDEAESHQSYPLEQKVHNGLCLSC